jgi:N-acetylneuraminic acid mutarotase
MPDPKDHFSTVVLNGKIYAIGGEYGHDQVHQQRATVHVYDPGTDKWTQLASLPLAKSHIEGGTFVSDGKIVMAGGQVDNFQPTAQVVSYDPAADVWTAISPGLPVVRQGAMVQRVGNQIVLSLGAVRTDQPQANTFLGKLP